ncbi:DUF2953 domain-containing protein [Paenibacillus tarimensis]
MWWWIAGILAIGWIVVLLSYIKVVLIFKKNGEDDKLEYEVKALLGLVRIRAEVPFIRLIGDGAQLEADLFNESTERQLGDFKENITARKAIGFYKNIKELTGHACGFSQWLSNAMSRVRCSQLRWITQIGVGDAPATAITAGVVWGIKTSIVHFLAQKVTLETKPHIEVTPQYNRKLFKTEALIVTNIRHFYLMMVLMNLLLRILKVRGGMKLWTSTISQTYQAWKDKKKARTA